MSTVTDRVNRDVVLPPIVREFNFGHSTIEQALIAAYERGLEFGYEVGAQAEADGEAGPNPFRRSPA